jgi:hypothetical protein
MHDVLAEVGLGLDHVADDPAEERDIGPRPDRDVEVGHLARAAIARIDMNHPCAPLFGLHHPPKPNRVRLGHVPALDHDAVGVLEVLLEVGGAAAPE